MWKLKVLVCVAILAVVANFLNDPLPDDIPGWWQSKLWLGLFRIIFTMPSIGNRLGYDWAEILQKSAYLPAILVPRSMAEGVTMTTGSFDDLPVQIYSPPSDMLSGRGVMYFHGGGWVVGQSAYYTDQLSRLAIELGAVVIYVDYRLAPKHPFPAAAEDCIASYKYFVEHAQEFKVDPARVAVMGESAGGNLAAVVSLDTLTTGYTPRPKLQVLFCPVLQGSNLHTPSYEANKDGPFLSQVAMAIFFAAYIFGEDYEQHVATILSNNHTSAKEKKLNAKEHLSLASLPQDELTKAYKEHLDFGDSNMSNDIREKFRNPLFAPIFAENLTGLPPAYISTCQYEVLRDDGFFYAKRLRDAKVKVEHHNFICFHWWSVLTEYVKEYYDEFTEVIRYMENNM